MQLSYVVQKAKRKKSSFREGPCSTILFTTLSFSPWNLKIGKLLSLTRNIRPFQFSHALEHHVLALYYTFLCEYHKELVIFVEPRTYLESWVIDIYCYCRCHSMFPFSYAFACTVENKFMCSLCSFIDITTK